MNATAQYIQRTRDLYDSLGYPPYDWYHADSPPAFARPQKPLRDSRLGMVSTAGVYVAGQRAYFYKDDTSVRRISRDTPVDRLRFSHVTENYLVEARQDPGTVFPLAALERLHLEGYIGELADNYYSCMGGIYSQRRVRDELIPTVRETVRDERLDMLLLVPL